MLEGLIEVERTDDEVALNQLQQFNCKRAEAKLIQFISDVSEVIRVDAGQYI